MLTLSYALHGSGWATASFESGSAHYEMRVSYLSDALGEMINAAIALKIGAGEVQFGFMDEPGEHRCIITRSGVEEARLRIVRHEEWMRTENDRGKEVFACDCCVPGFCEEVFRCCKRILDDHGEDRYREMWGTHDFPVESFERLSRLLRPPRSGTGN